MVERSATLDETYAALSHPVRRAMIRRLGSGEARVTELAAPFEISLAAASKHIRVLEGAGLVRRRVDGRDHFLRLDAAPLRTAEDWIERNTRLWERRLDRLDARLRKERGS